MAAKPLPKMAPACGETEGRRRTNPTGLNLSLERKIGKAGACEAALVADGNCLGAVAPRCEPPCMCSVPMAETVCGVRAATAASLCHALTPLLSVQPFLSIGALRGKETVSPSTENSPNRLWPHTAHRPCEIHLKQSGLGNAASRVAAVATQNLPKASPSQREAREVCALCCPSSAGTREKWESAASGP